MCKILKENYLTEKFQFGSVTAAIASKACRSALMIGTSLSKRNMESIVRNLGGLESPWQCPHGRPTVCHLKSINDLSKNNFDNKIKSCLIKLD